MRAGEIITVTPESVDRQLEQVVNVPAVFLVWLREGRPYLGKTGVLKRRLSRLLGPREKSSRMLHLRDLAERVEYWVYGSRLEANLLYYTLAKEHYPDEYTRILKLRQPSYVKLILSNAYPRTQVTTRLSGSESLHYGPFSSRAAAEQFEAGFLDFFQLRRCQEDLEPAVEHPGCAYGEMNKCLRPCQMVVSENEYASEAERVGAFLKSDGQSLLESIGHARERLSELMEFEEAARMHKRYERAAAMLQGRGELATEITRLSGMAVLPGIKQDEVNLFYFRNGVWAPGITLPLQLEEGKPVPMDRRIREGVEALPRPGRISLKERQEHTALLVGWYFSSWRDGEWVSVPDGGQLPYRKLVNAVHRVAKRGVVEAS